MAKVWQIADKPTLDTSIWIKSLLVNTDLSNMASDWLASVRSVNPKLGYQVLTWGFFVIKVRWHGLSYRYNSVTWQDFTYTFDSSRSYMVIHFICSIETKMLSFWRNLHHWLHWTLSNDNFQCSQWWWFHQNDNISVSVSANMKTSLYQTFPHYWA